MKCILLVALVESCGNWRQVTYFALFVPPLATPTCLLDFLRMGSLMCLLSCLLRLAISARIICYHEGLCSVEKVCMCFWLASLMCLCGCLI